jgi:hypothetical protein
MVFTDKLAVIGTQVFITLSQFTELESSLPSLQKPPTGPYPKPDKCTHPCINYFSKIHFNIPLPAFRAYVYQVVSSAELFLLHSVCISHFSHACYKPRPCVLLATSCCQYYVKSTNYEAPHYVLFCNLLVLVLVLTSSRARSVSVTCLILTTAVGRHRERKSQRVTL